MLEPIVRYLKAHWRGDHGLAWSFWMNFVALRAAIFFMQDLISPAGISDFSSAPIAVTALLLLFHGVIFIWQIVGVLRAGERFFTETGSQAAVWGAQIALVAGFWLTATYSLQAAQTLIKPNPEGNHLVRMDREHRSRYRIEPVDSQTVLIDGSMELGITRAFGAFLASQNGFKTAILNSSGGNVYEARGLARLFREHDMATHVDGNCSSACTAAFIGGRKRSISNGGRLGFHQYRIDADYVILNINPIEEQARDRAVFEQSAVAEWFLDRMFQRKSHEMWFPETAELLRAGVVHAIID